MRCRSRLKRGPSSLWYKRRIQSQGELLLCCLNFPNDDAMEGEALVVKCPRRNSAVKVTWYHTDTKKIIPEEEEGSRIFSLGRFLWFLPNSVEDSGNYTCVTHYPNNSTKEFNMSVKVHPYKEGICFPSRILYPNDTRRGRIVCPTFDNYKNATMIQWYKDCRPLHGERYLKKDKYIFISDLTKEDDGYYTCHFTYTHRGNVFNVSATRIFISEAKHLSLPAQILFPKEKDVIEVELGAPLSLKCQARLGIKKQPIDVVSWDVDNNPVIYTDTSRFHEETHFFEGQAQEYYKEATLHISEIKEEDLQSNFTCVVVNEMGNTRATVTLQLKAQYKASAIEKRIQKSRRLIILLTHQLLNCKEFAYDQHVALYNALIQNNTKVILLEMERMETYETLQESLKYIIKKQGTVKWKEQHTVHPQSSNSKFWKCVRYLMPLRLRSSYSVNAG
ncbi:interleukin-1 receptor-like 1 isoform X8 [Anas acuta]|uniref:interleukin-1 receptor-like 1 isoform X8 n=1 Tax=Anas acuta TaxID=28680 RepID=UPI0035C8AC4A